MSWLEGARRWAAELGADRARDHEVHQACVALLGDLERLSGRLPLGDARLMEVRLLLGDLQQAPEPLGPALRISVLQDLARCQQTVDALLA